MKTITGLALALLAASAAAEPGDINDYLVDISGGAVSAVALVGADPSASRPSRPRRTSSSRCSR